MAKKQMTVIIQVSNLQIEESKITSLQTTLAGQIQPSIVTMEDLVTMGIDISGCNFSVIRCTTSNEVGPGQSQFSGQIQITAAPPVEQQA